MISKFFCAQQLLLTFLLYRLEQASCAQFSIHFPKYIRHKTEESVIITARQASPRQSISVHVQVVSSAVRTSIFFNRKKRHTFENDHHVFHIPVKLSPSLEECQAPTDSSSHHLCTVDLLASVTEMSVLLWTKTIRVTVVKTLAQLYIQSDRPIYSPGDEVNVRFISLTDDLHPLNERALLTIKSPGEGGTIMTSWKKKVSFRDIVFVRKFRLPENCPLGLWNITAAYTSPTITSVDFHNSFFVEYTNLPSFSVVIEYTRDHFILPYDDDFRLQLISRTFHGVPVVGTAHVRFGMSSAADKDLTKITHVTSNLDLVNGDVTLSIPVSQLVGSASPDLRDGMRLLVIASVTKFGSGETRTTREDVVMFSSEPYTITFKNKRRMFQVGVPFLANVEIKFPNGSVAEGPDVSFTITSINAIGLRSIVNRRTVQTCQLGTAMIRFEPPLGSEKLNITASVKFLGHNGYRYLTMRTQILNVQATVSGEYITIEAPQERLQIGVTTIVQAYSKPQDADKMIFHHILKNGLMLSSNTVTMRSGDSNIPIHLRVSSEMSPAVVLCTYYFTGAGEIVEDRAILKVEKVCVGQEPIVLTRGGGGEQPLPGDEVSLEVRSEASALVSMVAGDMALKSVADEYIGPHPFDRESIFDSQEHLSQICSQGKLPDDESVDTCTSGSTLRRKRSLSEDAFQNSVTNLGYGFIGAAYDCCMVGSRDLSHAYGTNSTCQERTKNLQVEDECLAAFDECCRLAECTRTKPNNSESCFSRFSDEVESRSVSKSVSFSPFTTTMRTNFMVEKAVALRRRNFNPTWFFIDFRMDSTGRRVLNNQSVPKISKLQDTITAWNVDLLSISNNNGMCVGESLELPVRHTIYIEVMTVNRPVVVGTPVSVEVTIYNQMYIEVEVNVILEGVEGLCSNAKPGKDSAPSRYIMPGAYDNIPRTAAARFIIVPLVAGDFTIKVKMNGRHGDATRPVTDVVEKKLVVIPEGNVKKKTDWILVDSRDNIAPSFRSGVTSRRLFLLPTLNEDAIPGTLNVKMTWHSLPSATMLTPTTGNRPQATIQGILYRLHPALARLEYAELDGNLTTETRNNLLQSITECYNAVLGFVRLTTFRYRIDDVSYDTYGISHSPASNSKPSMKLTSSTLELLYKVAKFVIVDKDMLLGCLRWVASHQMPNGYFRTKPFEFDSKARHGAVYPGDRLFMTNVDRKIYLTSTVLLDLLSVKESVENLTLSDDASLQERSSLMLHTNLLYDVIQLGESYLQIKIQEVNADVDCYRTTSLSVASHALYRLQRRENYILNSAISKWNRILQRGISRAESHWIETCTYNPENFYIDQTIEKSNTIEATAHVLQKVNLQGDRGERYANMLMYNRNVDGHWASLRATLAAMQGLKSYNLIEHALEENSLPHIELTDRKLRNTGSLKVESPIELNSARYRVAFTTQGFGMAWVKLETTYSLGSSTSSEEQTVKSRHKRSFESKDSCPYEISVSLSASKDLFVSSRATRRSRVAWDVALSVTIKSPYNATSQYDSYVMDFGLPVGSKPFEIDLEKLFNPIEHVLDHYRLTERSILLYMTGTKRIRFRISDPNMKSDPIPIEIYPVSAPEVFCSEFYNFPGLSKRPSTFCGGTSKNSPCHCAAGRSCPTVLKTKKSARTTLEKRISVSCKKKSTFAYKVLLKRKSKFDSSWYRYEGVIKAKFRLADGTEDVVRVDQKHAFWVKTTCKKLALRRSYLVVGYVVNSGKRGVFEHLLDGDVWMETWKSDSGGCSTKKKLSNACKAQFKLGEYEYTMTRSPCPTI